MIQLKICMVGAYGVGKTSLVKRFVESIFDEKYHTTIGVKIDKKRLQVDGIDVTLMIWDLAGEDEVEQVKISHLRGASGYILVADGCRAATITRAGALTSAIDETIGIRPFVFAINKVDLRDQWESETAQTGELGERAAGVFLTSAKTGSGVEEMFRSLAIKMLGKKA
jgi:small GTP-binding protein